MSQSSYIPGMCNINRAEIAYRRKAMWFGVVVSIIVVCLLLLLHAPWWLGAALLFVPVYIAAINYLQVTKQFCVSYAASGRHNADEGSDHAQVITDPAAVNADKLKARRINLQALAVTLAVLAGSCTVLYFL